MNNKDRFLNKFGNRPSTNIPKSSNNVNNNYEVNNQIQKNKMQQMGQFSNNDINYEENIYYTKTSNKNIHGNYNSQMDENIKNKPPTGNINNNNYRKVFNPSNSNTKLTTDMKKY